MLWCKRWNLTKLLLGKQMTKKREWSDCVVTTKMEVRDKDAWKQQANLFFDKMHIGKHTSNKIQQDFWQNEMYKKQWHNS